MKTQRIQKILNLSRRCPGIFGKEGESALESGPVLLPFFHILRFYLRQKRLLLAAFFLTLIQCAAHLYMPILMAVVVDRGVLEGNLAVISRTGWKMAAACLILVLAGYLSNIICEIAGARLAHRLRMEVYEKLPLTPNGKIDRVKLRSTFGGEK